MYVYITNKDTRKHVEKFVIFFKFQIWVILTIALFLAYIKEELMFLRSRSV